MKTVNEAAIALAEKEYPHMLSGNDPNKEWEYGYNAARDPYFRKGFIEGSKFAQRWIPINEELPEISHVDCEGYLLSKHILIKTDNSSHPFIGYYIKEKENEDAHFVFIPEYITSEEMLDAITHWRPIELK